jgi:hypothetical protein
MFFRLALVLALAGTSVMAQDKGENFVIDPSKPFAYLKFDHVAERKQSSPDESPKGLWLRLMNNSRLPIVVTANGAESGERGATIEYDVVQIAVKGLPHGVRFPGFPPGAESPAEEEKNGTDSKPPKRFSIEVGSLRTIRPGGSLLFDVPLNAVGRSWYLQVGFHFQLPGARAIQAPTILVDFWWQDLPKENREQSAP